MSFEPLRTDYKNDVLKPSMNGKRHYQIVDSDGVSILYPDVILNDISQYDVRGDKFGKDDINAMNEMANRNRADNEDIIPKVENLNEQVSNAEMYASEANLAKNNAIMYSSYAEEAAEQARISAEKAGEFTPEGYNEFVASTNQSLVSQNEHLSTLDESVESLQDQIGSHENLLDNGWFTVNQRGQSEYTVAGYTVDRLYMNSSKNSVVVNDDYLTFNFLNSQYTAFLQYLKPELLKNGETYTYSIMLEDGTIHSKTFTYSNNGTWTNLIVIEELKVYSNYRYESDRNAINIHIIASTTIENVSVSIKAVKLELGTVSTLANDTPPNYALEKYKCTMSTADSADTYANGGMIKGTLSAGATSITLTDSRITTNSIFRFFTSKFGVSPTACTVNNGSVILTFESQSEPITVGVKVE